MPIEDGVTDSCLDGETIAAWLDGGLSGDRLALAHAHAADCGRCQAIVGTAGRIDAVALRSMPEHSPGGWLTWLVPLTAAAAAVAVTMTVPSRPEVRVLRTSVMERPRGQVAGARAVPPRDRPSAAEIAGRDQAKAAAAALRDRASAKADTNDGPRWSTTGRRASESSGAAVIPIPAALPPRGAAPRRRDETMAEAVAKRLAASASAARPSASGEAVEVVSPDPLIRWRIAGTVVERTTDGGARWRPAATPIAAVLSAGAAPSASVCWLVGRAGIVLLSPAGRGWNRRPFPEAVDLSAVSATNARAAAVSTADGRTFVTADGGATWMAK